HPPSPVRSRAGRQGTLDHGIENDPRTQGRRRQESLASVFLLGKAKLPIDWRPPPPFPTPGEATPAALPLPQRPWLPGYPRSTRTKPRSDAGPRTPSTTTGLRSTGAIATWTLTARPRRESRSTRPVASRSKAVLPAP